MLWSALVTPFREVDGAPDLPAMAALARFQLDHGCDGVLLFGSTGEALALRDDERGRVLDAVLEVARPEQVMVGLGAGGLADVLARAREAGARGVRDLLLADAPYSGASSAALRTRWHEPVARALPESRLFPYAAPSRTGTELLPDDLARLAEDCPNVAGVKDATGRLARMLRVRELCGEDFSLLCGDDAVLRDALLDPHIRADGAISVLANLAPAAVRALHDAGREGRAVRARELHDALLPLLGLVNVTAVEDLPLRGEVHAVPQRSRDPVPLKAALARFGACEATVRAPLGPMGPRGGERVASVLESVARFHADVLAPLGAAFGGAAALAQRAPAARSSNEELAGSC
ncbi:MAG TPA: dihydrodipicolinate synthase family protein [Planctomycetota bacterium]|nr:dihydrodipicolinate synthase family protein [Planctomycetota bacterium]